MQNCASRYCNNEWAEGWYSDHQKYLKQKLNGQTSGSRNFFSCQGTYEEVTCGEGGKVSLTNGAVETVNLSITENPTEPMMQSEPYT
jgi:hypothetical protein